MLKKMKGKMKRRNTEPAMAGNQVRFTPAEPVQEDTQEDEHF